MSNLMREHNIHIRGNRFQLEYFNIMGASSVFWVLSVMGALCGFQVLGLILVGLFGFFPIVSWLWWFLCILPVYLEALYAF
jgi:hypothetical protein